MNNIAAIGIDEVSNLSPLIRAEISSVAGRSWWRRRTSLSRFFSCGSFFELLLWLASWLSTLIYWRFIAFSKSGDTNSTSTFPAGLVGDQLERIKKLRLKSVACLKSAGWKLLDSSTYSNGCFSCAKSYSWSSSSCNLNSAITLLPFTTNHQVRYRCVTG